jgi:hypothetical protein
MKIRKFAKFAYQEKIVTHRKTGEYHPPLELLSEGLLNQNMKDVDLEGKG